MFSLSAKALFYDKDLLGWILIGHGQVKAGNWRSGRLDPVPFSISVRQDAVDAPIVSENSSVLR
jgi:hypothetical protein